MTSGAITWPKSERRRNPNGSEQRSVESGPPIYWVFQFLPSVRADTTLTLCAEHHREVQLFCSALRGLWCWGTTMLRDNRDSGAERQLSAHNVLGEPLEICSMRPMTGFHRDGCCNTGREDVGSHTVCAVMTAAFLDFSQSRQRSFDSGAGTWFSGPEIRRSLVFVCASLAGGIRSKPSAPCRLARHARGCLVLLLTRRSQTSGRGFGVNRRTQSRISSR